MLTIDTYKYYQPSCPLPSGEVVMPYGLHSFEAFRTREDCEKWLVAHKYTPSKWDILEYANDDIEGVTLLDAEGNVIMPIEEVPDDGIADMLADEVLLCAGSIDNLLVTKQSDESQQEFEDRLYTDALDAVNDAIATIEEENEYNFAAYAGCPETDWYDEGRDEAVKQVLRWMTGQD